MPLLKSRRSKILVAALLVFAILFAVFFVYFAALIGGLSNLTGSPALPSPSLSSYLSSQLILSYNNGSYEVPYVSVFYNTSNAIQLNAEASIYKSPLPTHLYILNYSQGCFDCGNATVAVRSLIAGIRGYGMTWLYANTSNITMANLGSIKNNSILVIVTGLIPSGLEANNFSEVKSLLAKRTSILYVGRNFSSTLVSGVVPEPAPSSGVPAFLSTMPEYGRGSGGVFAFNSPTFRFRNGSTYDFVSYENVGNGSVVAFTNVLASWPSEQSAGADMATVIWQMFWLPRYAYGSTLNAGIRKGGTGSLGIVMDKTRIRYNATVPEALDSGYMRIVVGASPLYSGKPTAYAYITGGPRMATRGKISIEPNVSPNASGVMIDFNITSAPQRPVNLSTFIQIYNQNLSQTGWAEQGPTVNNFSAGSHRSFFNYYNIDLGPGSYIVVLTNFTDRTEIAAGHFIIPKYTITPILVNFSSGTFVFRFSSRRTPINNIRYNVSVNGLPPETGVAQAGILFYKLPSGAPALAGALNFTFSMLGQKTSFRLVNVPSPFTIDTPVHRARHSRGRDGDNGRVRQGAREGRVLHRRPQPAREQEGGDQAQGGGGAVGVRQAQRQLPLEVHAPVQG